MIFISREFRLTLTRSLSLIGIALFLWFDPSLFTAHAESWRSLPKETEGQRTPLPDDHRPFVPAVIRKIPLEDVSYFVKGGAIPDVEVKFSPNGQLLAIGTFLGRLRVVDIYSGAVKLDLRIAEGMVKQIDFSPDGKSLYYGEQSLDAFIVAVDLISGEERWRYRMSVDLGTGKPPAKNDIWGIYKLPGCYQLKTLDSGDILVLGIHSRGSYAASNQMTRLSRVYLFSPSGTLKWGFPSDGPARMSMIYADGARNGSRVAVLASTYGKNTPKPYRYKKNSLYVLNGKNGRVTGHYTFQPLRPYFDSVSFWQSVSVGVAGEKASVGTMDGRSYLFNLQTVRPDVVFHFGAPIQIGKLPVCANATYTRLAPDGTAYFQIGRSTVASGGRTRYVVAPPGPHPGANTINAVDTSGKIKWRYRDGHLFQNFWSSRDGRWLLTTAQKESEETGKEFGALLFDTHRPGGGSAKRLYYYQVEGMIFFNADLADDGSALALVEVPYYDPKSGKMAGSYQVHLIR